MPALEVLAEVMEESGKGISIATVDCTVFKQLCTNRFNIRVNHSAEICYSAFSRVVLAQEVTDRHVAKNAFDHLSMEERANLVSCPSWPFLVTALHFF